MDWEQIHTLLNLEAEARNKHYELSELRPDPLMVARSYPDEHFALTCALFAYGNVKAIVSFLSTLDPFISTDEISIRRILTGKYYRFQTTEDIIQWFITLNALRKIGGAEKVFMKGYDNGKIVNGLSCLINTLYELNPYRSQGYEFLIGKPITTIAKASAMKRWMMYLRWMVRHDNLDMGLWKKVKTSDLIMPLDTHTFQVSRSLGLLQRKQCDLRAAIELTETLRQFDFNDPVRYDFALYRIGQEKILSD